MLCTTQVDTQGHDMHTQRAKIRCGSNEQVQFIRNLELVTCQYFIINNYSNFSVKYSQRKDSSHFIRQFKFLLSWIFKVSYQKFKSLI